MHGNRRSRVQSRKGEHIGDDRCGITHRVAPPAVASDFRPLSPCDVRGRQLPMAGGTAAPRASEMPSQVSRSSVSCRMEPEFGGMGRSSRTEQVRQHGPSEESRSSCSYPVAISTPRINNEAVAHVLSDSMVPISPAGVTRARVGLRFHYRAPMESSSLSECEKNVRLCFAGKRRKRERLEQCAVYR
jgi:hypothetical protein